MCKQMIIALALLALSVGCQGYRPVPLDLAAQTERFSHRDPGAEGVLEFARRLDVDGAGASGRFDVSDGLSVHEAEAVALFYNADLRLLRAESGVARASAEHAGAWEDPHLQGELLRFTGNMPERWISAVGVQFTLPISGRLAVEKDQAKAELTLARQRVRAAEWGVLEQVRQTWIRWATLRRRQALVHAYLNDLSKLMDVVRKMVEAGELDPTDLGSLKIEQVSHRLLLVDLEAHVSKDRLALMGLMGLKAEADLDLLAAFPVEKTPATESDRVLLDHPRMAVARARYERAEQNLRREIHKQYPDLEIGPAFEREEGQSRIGLSAGIPIPSINLNRQGIAEAKAERAVARVEALRTYERLKAALAAAKLEARAARRRREALVDQMAPVVARQRRQLQTLIEIGELNVLMMSQVLEHDLKIKTELLEAAAAEATARQKIDGLIGARWLRPAASGTKVGPKELQP